MNQHQGKRSKRKKPYYERFRDAYRVWLNARKIDLQKRREKAKQFPMQGSPSQLRTRYKKGWLTQGQFQKACVERLRFQ